ncbi:MAG TPA: hypothetical protein VEA78_02560 [Acidimicrobiales bacterium]|nr:hypothetical protein [Acidimicrobiales bacterium]
MSDFEDQVRETLRAKASEAQVSPGGLDAIRAKLASAPGVVAAPRRTRAPWLVAAAAAVVVAVVGGALVTSSGDDGRDPTGVAGEGEVAGAASTALDAVWPTDDPVALAAMDDEVLATPEDAFAAYLEDRLGWDADTLEPATPLDADLDDGELVLGYRMSVASGGIIFDVDDADGIESATGAADPGAIVGGFDVHLRRLGDDGPWYVQEATSSFLAVRASFDGAALRGDVVPASAGDLEIMIETSDGSGGAGSSIPDAEAGTSYPLEGTVDADAVIARVLLRDADDGVVALHEERVASADGVDELLDAVWPTDDPDQLLSISAGYVLDPAESAAAYLSDRLGRQLTADLIVFDDERDIARLDDGTPVEVHLGRHEQTWYVQRATSDLLHLSVDHDGERVDGIATAEAPGDMTVLVGTRASASGPVEAGKQIDFFTTPVGARVVVRTTLVGDAGNMALDERLVVAPDDRERQADAEQQIADIIRQRETGVWPKPSDDGFELTDPVAVAEQYLDAVGVSSFSLSDFREGDNSSGEVEVTGDVIATIALRVLEGRWHVEAVHTPLIEARGDVPGELWLHATVEGDLAVTVLDTWGTVVQSMPQRRLVEGEEVVVVPADPMHKPFTVRYRFSPVVGNPGGIGDVFVPGTGDAAPDASSGEHEVPDEAVHVAGGLDPIGTAQAYIEARLGFWPDDMVFAEGQPAEDAASVTWEHGYVFLVRHDGLWYVTHAAGEVVSVLVANAERVTVETTEPGLIEVRWLDDAGAVCAESSLDVDGGGRHSVDTPDATCEPRTVIAVLNEVLAEKRISP